MSDPNQPPTQPGYPQQGQQPGYPSQGQPGYPPQGAPGYQVPPPGYAQEVGAGYPQPEGAGMPPGQAPHYYAPPPGGWSEPRPPKYPQQPEQYHYFWRAPGIAAWRLVLMLALAPVAFLVVSLVGTAGVLAISAVRGQDIMEVLQQAEQGQIGPDLLVANMVALALLVPVCLVLALLSRQRPGFLSSVIGKFRWGWSLICFLVALGAVIIAGAAMELLASSEAQGTALEVHSYSWALFAILMVVTPLQAAGEEYLLRGIGFRALASLFPWRTVGLVIAAVATSAVFMAIHAASDPWLNAIYFTMGMLFCYLTWRTGGIEAAVAMHVANNIVGMALVPFTDFSDLFDRSEGAGSSLMLIQLVMLILATVVIELLARRRKLAWAVAPENGTIAVSQSRITG